MPGIGRLASISSAARCTGIACAAIRYTHHACSTRPIETPLPTVRFEDLALTSTRSADNTGVRVQVLRRQPVGSWLRIIDRPEVPQP
jgi:hypothetical protein